MLKTNDNIEALNKNMLILSNSLIHSESRLRKLEHFNHWLIGLVSFFLLAAIFLGIQLAAPGSAFAEEQQQEDMFQRLEEKVIGLEHKMAEALKHEKKKFKSMIGNVRKRVNESEVFDPTHAVAVILYDMKEMLEAVPRMAEDTRTMSADMHQMMTDMHQMNQKISAVPVMATEMQSMNVKIGILAHGVDSTLGRTGRMMPWMP